MGAPLSRWSVCQPCCSELGNYTTTVFDTATGKYLYDINSQWNDLHLPISQGLFTLDVDSSGNIYIPGKHQNMDIQFLGNGQLKFTMHQNAIGGTWGFASGFIGIGNIPYNVTATQFKALMDTFLNVTPATSPVTVIRDKPITSGFIIKMPYFGGDCITGTFAVETNLITHSTVRVYNKGNEILTSNHSIINPGDDRVPICIKTDDKSINLGYTNNTLQSNVEVAGGTVNGGDFNKTSSFLLVSKPDLLGFNTISPPTLLAGQCIYNYPLPLQTCPNTIPAGTPLNGGETVDPGSGFTIKLTFGDGTTDSVRLSYYWRAWSFQPISLTQGPHLPNDGSNITALGAHNMGLAGLIDDIWIDPVTSAFFFDVSVAWVITYGGPKYLFKAEVTADSLGQSNILYGQFAGNGAWLLGNFFSPFGLGNPFLDHFSVTVQETVGGPILTSPIMPLLNGDYAGALAAVTGALSVNTIYTKHDTVMWTKYLGVDMCTSGFCNGSTQLYSNTVMTPDWNHPVQDISYNLLNPVLKVVEYNSPLVWFNILRVNFHVGTNPPAAQRNYAPYATPDIGVSKCRQVWPSCANNPGQPIIGYPLNQSKSKFITIWKDGVESQVMDGQLSDFDGWFSANFGPHPTINLRGDWYPPMNKVYRFLDQNSHILLAVDGYSDDVKNGIFRIYDLSGNETPPAMYLQSPTPLRLESDSNNIYYVAGQTSRKTSVSSVDLNIFRPNGGLFYNNDYTIYKIDKASGKVAAKAVFDPQHDIVNNSFILYEPIQSWGLRTAADIKFNPFNSQLYVIDGINLYAYDAGLSQTLIKTNVLPLINANTRPCGSVAFYPGGIWLMGYNRVWRLDPSGNIINSTTMKRVDNNDEAFMFQYITNDMDGYCYLASYTNIFDQAWSNVRRNTSVFKLDLNCNMVWASNNPYCSDCQEGFPQDPYHFIKISRDGKFVIANGVWKQKVLNAIPIFNVSDKINITQTGTDHT